MTSEEILAAIAPCGLNCKTCFAHVDGDIRKHALKLKEKLGNFAPYAKRFETLLGETVFKSYPAFKEMLDYLAAEHCRGCRNEQCKLFKDCGVRKCHQAKQVDYCHQCNEFPCNKNNFDERLHGVWLQINRKIQEIGLEKFHERSKTRPRYV
jgi:hypothetical protein